MVPMAMLNESSNGDKQPGILIVDDEPHIVDFLEVGFSYEGFRVLVATTGPEAIEMATMHQPDVIILDIMLPGLNGLEVMRRIRKASDVAVIMLTAKEGVDDRVMGLDTGADDYMTKPFAFKELMARVRAVLRRHGNHFAGILTFQHITLDRGTHIVTSDGQLVSLTPR